MQEIKIENWNGNEIRFVDVNGEWYAVLKDVCNALGVGTREVHRRLTDDVLSKHHIPDTLGRQQEMLLVNELGIYKTIFQSRKAEAEQFQLWVYQMLSELRKQSGLEGFEIFRTLDKEYQLQQMSRLHKEIDNPSKKTYIKANTIADKVVSCMHGLPKMLKKDKMTPQMLVERQEVLDSTVELMTMQDKYGVPEHVSPVVKKKFNVLD